jgi:hypothetical protein
MPEDEEMEMEMELLPEDEGGATTLGEAHRRREAGRTQQCVSTRTRSAVFEALEETPQSEQGGAATRRTAAPAKAKRRRMAAKARFIAHRRFAHARVGGWVLTTAANEEIIGLHFEGHIVNCDCDTCTRKNAQKEPFSRSERRGDLQYGDIVYTPT